VILTGTSRASLGNHPNRSIDCRFYEDAFHRFDPRQVRLTEAGGPIANVARSAQRGAFAGVPRSSTEIGGRGLWLACPRGVRASRIGQMAKRMLDSPGWSGRVLAVVSGAVYLAGLGEEILWLTHQGLPAHRRCIQAPFQTDGLCSGVGCWVRHGRLVLGDCVAIDLADASVWEPPANCPGQATVLPLVNAGFRRFLAALGSPEVGKGLGQAVPLIAALARREDLPVTSPEDHLMALALRPITRAARACLGRDTQRLIWASEQLIGLGPGLTPSGDDYAGGLLFTVHHLKSAYPSEFGWDPEGVLDLLHKAYPLTNAISHTVLSDLAYGHGPEPLHDLLNAFLQAKPVEHLLVSVDRLTGIGHTSGWDMLAGVLTGMLLTETVDWTPPGDIDKEMAVLLISF